MKDGAEPGAHHNGGRSFGEQGRLKRLLAPADVWECSITNACTRRPPQIAAPGRVTGFFQARRARKTAGRAAAAGDAQ